MDIVLEENSRLKALLLSYQTRDVEQRRTDQPRQVLMSNGELKRKGGSLEDDDEDRDRERDAQQRMHSFPFPDSDGPRGGHGR